MAPITLYQASIPVLIRGLNNLSTILKKGEMFADEKGIPHSELLDTRLVADMAALPYQVQRVSDTAKGVAVRLGGQDPVPMADTETTFAELQERIQKTIDVLKSVPEESINGKEEVEITVVGNKLSGTGYVLGFALPNFFFHVTTTYALLRHKGVPVGKTDYLGKP